MRIRLLILLFFGVGNLFSQTITGTVREKESGLPLPFANVFISNTTLGKATHKDGRFRISGDLPQEIEVVASFVGYITEVKVVSTRGKSEIQVDFELAINESSLSEVQLKSRRDKTWDREFRRFEEVFLALTDDPYKSKVEIQNPWVVDFKKIKADKGPNYISASAQEPLKIINKALGYEIEYYLQDFRLSRNGSRFYGQVYYETLEDNDLSEEWISARNENFYQSIRFLNKSILLNSKDTSHFEIFEVKKVAIDRDRTNDFSQEVGQTLVEVSMDSIFRRPLGDGNFRIFLPGRMEIHHVDKPWINDYYIDVYHAISWILAPEGFYDVDRNGLLLNPTQLVLSGYLGRQRMARILPLDFEPTTGFFAGTLDSEVIELPVEKQNQLREKPWLSTNKPYFYPGETLWLGGQMLYQESIRADSLSRVLYVDLLGIDSAMLTFTFPIVEGRISGGFEIPKSLPVGDYALRAYTNWNRNYPETDWFEMALPILDPNYRPIPVLPIEEELFGGITIESSFSISDSLSYRMMDLELSFLDEFQNPIDATFILSLTDAEEVSFLDKGNGLEKAMEWLDQDLQSDFMSTGIYPIEYGISVKGSFIQDTKRRSLAQQISIVRGDLEDFGQVMSDSLGRFWATGLSFLDTAQVAIAAIDDQLRPFGSIELTALERPKPPSILPRLSYQVEPISQETPLLDLSGDFILLEEFVKEEVKERETMADRNYGYGTPTRELGEEELAKIGTWEQFFGELALFNNYNYGEKTGPPLVILNGQKFPFIDPGEILADLVPAEVESIKVYNDNISKSIFGMLGYGGVFMIETKKGFRSGPESDQKFNSDGFDLFQISGFSRFTSFPNEPPSDQFLKRKPTVYWNPAATTENGLFKSQVRVPYGVKVVRVKVEGQTQDGEVIDRILELRL
jgi:hypothetical protein